MVNFWELLNPNVPIGEMGNPAQYTVANVPSPLFSPPPPPPPSGSPEWQKQQAAASKVILPQPTPTPAALPPFIPSQQAVQQVQVQQVAPPQAATPAPPQERVEAWKGFLDSLKDPDVLGPIQTFLATVAAPLQPGESLGARIGYASTLMQMHKRMLEENAINEPLRRREQEAKVRNEELRGAETEARTAAANQQINFNAKTEDIRIKELLAKAEIAIKEQNLRAAQAAMEELKLMYYPEAERINNRYKQALADQAEHAANAPYSVETKEAKNKQELSKAYADVERVLGMFETSSSTQPFKTVAEREAAFRAWLAMQDRPTAEAYVRGRQMLLDAGYPLPVLAERGKKTTESAGAVPSQVRKLSDVKKNLETKPEGRW
jgi:hypothetical protein